MPTAYTRAVSPRLPDCALTHIGRTPIDVARARQQHADYCRALAAAGLALAALPALDAAPDGVFVEDTAVLLGTHAVITRPGDALRRSETASTAATLAGRFTLHPLDQGRLDGGDVLRIGRTLYVGLSARTDAAGAQAFAALVTPLGFAVVEVAVRGCLHLKTAVTAAGPDRAGDPVLVVNPGWVDPATLPTAVVVPVAVDEPFAANTLRVGDTLLVAAGAPRTRDALAARGFTLVELAIDELQKAEAGLTCMSLITDPP